MMFSASPRVRNCLRLGVGGKWGPEHPKALRRIGALARQLLMNPPEALAA